MKIVDLKCAVIGKSPIVRIVTDEGISAVLPYRDIMRIECDNGV